VHWACSLETVLGVGDLSGSEPRVRSTSVLQYSIKREGRVSKKTEINNIPVER
jgi:hypothetical protein